jgi:hypothetical protein
MKARKRPASFTQAARLKAGQFGNQENNQKNKQNFNFISDFTRFELHLRKYVTLNPFMRLEFTKKIKLKTESSLVYDVNATRLHLFAFRRSCPYNPDMELQAFDLPERTWADRLGICLSALCIVHCLLTPVVFLLLPGLSLFAYHEAFHLPLLIALPALALLAFIPGFRRHQDPKIFFWAVPGMALVVVAVLVFENNIWLEVPLSISGSLCLIRAHVLNRRLCACCVIGHNEASAVRTFSEARLPRFRSPIKLRDKLLTPPRT